MKQKTTPFTITIHSFQTQLKKIKIKKITILILATITIAFTATPDFKKAGFSGPQIASVDFTSLQAAHDDTGRWRVIDTTKIKNSLF